MQRLKATHFIEVWRINKGPKVVYSDIEEIEELLYTISNYTIAIFKIKFKS